MNEQQEPPQSEPPPQAGPPEAESQPGARTEATQTATQPPPGEPPPGGPAAAWGAPPPPPRPRGWSTRYALVTAAIAVVLAAATGVIVYLVTDAHVDDRGGAPTRVFPKAPGDMRVGPMPGGPRNGAQHGEFQNGEVTAISDESITVKSDDGYSKTYAIDSDTTQTDGIQKGDDVMVVATSGDKSTATVISEAGKGVQFPGRGNRPGG
jgi:hypothetical protein